MIGAQEHSRSVGALAHATGLTVRTLHHWDAIGLLVPSERTGAGHPRHPAGAARRAYRTASLRAPPRRAGAGPRRYTEGDVRRLYRIVSLRSLGLGLDAIADALDGAADL